MENTNTMTGKPATEIVGVTETQEETFSEWCDKKVPFDKEKSKLAGENRAKEMTTHDRMDGLILISDKEKIKSATKSIMIDLHREGFYVEDIMQFIYELARGEIK